MMKKLSVVFLPLLFFSCWSSEIDHIKNVNQESVYARYTVEINEDEETVNMRAVFRFGGDKGTTLILDDPSFIKINHQKLSGNKEFLAGYVYRGEIPLSSVKKDSLIQIEFKDFKGKLYTHTYQVRSFIIPGQQEISKKSRSKVYFTPWLEADETMEITMSDKKNVSASSTTSEYNQSYVTFTPDAMDTLQTGTIKLQAQKTYQTSLDHFTQEGGSLTVIHTARSVNGILK